MLLSFKCRNFRSIKDSIAFSAIAVPSFKEHEKNLISLGDESVYDKKIIRFAEIYGANASGKSNVLKSLYFMAQQISSSYENENSDKIPFMPHKLSDSNDTSDFSIWFIKNNYKYYYAFSVSQNGVEEEKLCYYPNGKKVVLFERTNHKFRMVKIKDGNDSFTNDIINDQLKPNRFLLSVAGNTVDYAPIKEAFSFFRNDIIFINPNKPNLDKLIDRSISVNEELLKKTTRFMHTFSPNIKSLLVEIGDNIPQESFNQMKKKYDGEVDLSNAVFMSTKAVYDSFSVEMQDESDGINSVFNIAPIVVSAFSSDKILLWDEIERSLHPVIVKDLVKWFCNNKDSNTQVIVSTHNTDILDLNLVRRDQIWFTQMNSNRATELYSLAEIKDIQSEENVKKGYIEGKYGAIPITNLNLLKDLEK